MKTIQTASRLSSKTLGEKNHQARIYRHPTSFLWQESFSVYNQFCEAVVNAKLLSWEEMMHAACRYCIGSSKKHGVIFWQIDAEGRVHDGKVMYYQPDCHRMKNCHPTWAVTLYARRLHLPRGSWTSSHCFFGLHLTIPMLDMAFSETTPVAIVEAEKTAFILSEKFPQYIWLAAGGMGEVQPYKFRPLRGRHIIMFPDTDTEGRAFKLWSNAAHEVMASAFWEDSPPIRVSPILELHATPDQKQRKIDLVDYLYENP